jgi:hypothetical protein
MATLFNRAGEAFEVNVREGAKPYRSFKPMCGRCGGAGGSPKWAHTGYTCFDCNGAGVREARAEPLYTREQLDALITRKAKADAKRVAAAVAKREKEEARRDADRTALVAAEKPFLDRIAYVVDTTGDTFAAQIWRQIVREVRPISEAQRDAVEASLVKLEVEKARRLAARHVGAVGDRSVFELFFVREMFFENDFGGTFLNVARDADGNTFVYWGKWNGLGFPTEMRNGEREIVVGSSAMVKATIKDHRRNKASNEPETVISRPAVVRAAS